jgi:hypothetical protein
MSSREVGQVFETRRRRMVRGLAVNGILSVEITENA